MKKQVAAWAALLSGIICIVTYALRIYNKFKSVSIIGGADTPTLCMLIRIDSLNFIPIIGIALLILGIVLVLLSLKKKQV